MTDTAQASAAILRADDITLTYQDGRNVIYAVKGVDLTIAAGEFVGILGPSGSGKTSLLYALSGIRRPVSGQVYLNGQPLDAAGSSRETLRRLRLPAEFPDQLPERGPEHRRRRPARGC